MSETDEFDYSKPDHPS